MKPTLLRTRHIVLFLCVVVVIGALWLAYSRGEAARATAFYTASLQNAHISRDVTVGGVRYTVKQGSVTAAGTVTAGQTLKALELAYAATVAERSPQFALAGTDPDKLDAEVNQLARVQQAQADSLRIPSNIDIVRTSLYPVQFLRSLAALERARLNFVASGSDTDETLYAAALKSTAAAQAHDIDLFQKAYLFLGYNNVRFPAFGGTVTSDNIVSALAHIQSAAAENAASAKRQTGCFEGQYSACNAVNLAVPTPSPASDTHNAAAEKLSQEVTSMFKQAIVQYTPGTSVALATSTCLAGVSGPYIFNTPDLSISAQGRQASFRYIGDFFFSTSTGPLRKFTNNTVSAPVSLTVPTNFYDCFDKGQDVARVSAVALTAEFARTHPAIAKAGRTKLLASDILHEDDAITYVRSGLQNLAAYTPAEQSGLIGLALMFNNNSAGLDTDVQDVWSLNENNLSLIKAGYSFDDSLLFLVGTHSAFLTFFQNYNPSVVPQGVSVYDRSPAALTALISRMLRYSQTRPAYHDDIVQFLHQYHAFEKGLDS